MMFLSLLVELAYIKTPTYEAEVRAWHDGNYLVVVKGPHLTRCIGVPKVLRSGRPGLEVALEEVEMAIKEALNGH